MPPPHATSRWKRPAARLFDLAVLAAALLPVLAWLEDLWRSPTAVLVLRHHVLEALVVICLLAPVALLLLAPLTTTVAAFSTPADRWTKLAGPSRRAAFVSLATLHLAVQVAATAPWFWLAAWRPGVGAALGVVSVAGWLAWGRRVLWGRILWPVAQGLLAAIWLVASFGIEYRLALDLPQTRLYDRAAYDAAYTPTGELVVLSANDDIAIRLTDEGPRPVPRSFAPQRLVTDAAGNVFVANFGARWRLAVTHLRGDEVETIALPDCAKPIDIVSLPHGRFAVVCEFSGTIHVYDPRLRRVEKTERVPRLPYAVALDQARERLYVASENVTGRVTRVDIAGDQPPLSRSLGHVNWDAEFDPTTRRLFVARPVAGEIAVLDENLRVVGRVPVGSAPRELALDIANRRLLVAHYFSGVIGEIDIDTLTVSRTFRAGKAGPWHQFRGLGITADGAWLASDTNGVWRLTPPLR